MNNTVAAPRNAAAHSRSNSVEGLSSLVTLIESYLDYRRERGALLALDNHLLKDIGISRADAERISHMPFSMWRKKRAA